jgi:hypothetical protein
MSDRADDVLERDLSALACAVEATLKAALDRLKGEQAPGRSDRARRRIGALQEGIERRSLRLITGRGDGAARRRAVRSFNESVLLAALADCAEQLAASPVTEGGGSAPVQAMADAALACACDLKAGRRKVAGLNAAIADARRRAPEAAPAALVLEQVGELISGLQRGRRAAMEAAA